MSNQPKDKAKDEVKKPLPNPAGVKASDKIDQRMGKKATSSDEGSHSCCGTDKNKH